MEHTQYLIVPGWQGSSEQHWQSYWHRTLPNASRVEQKNWLKPERNDWVAELQSCIEHMSGAIVLIAHSLGCVAVTHWAAQADAKSLAKIRGALLVAPADVERVDCPEALQNFSPMTQRRLPFTSILVGSTNDAAATPHRAAEFAQSWGSQLVILPNAGHINVASGHHRWEQGFAWLYRLQALAELDRAYCA